MAGKGKTEYIAPNIYQSIKDEFQRWVIKCEESTIRNQSLMLSRSGVGIRVEKDLTDIAVQCI